MRVKTKQQRPAADLSRCEHFAFTYPSCTVPSPRLLQRRYPGRWQDLQREFGREYTQLSRIFNEVVDWAYDNHLHRVTDCLEFFSPRFPQMCKKIEAKGDHFNGVVLGVIVKQKARVVPLPPVDNCPPEPRPPFLCLAYRY
jgi:hypothetical protein